MTKVKIDVAYYSEHVTIVVDLNSSGSPILGVIIKNIYVSEKTIYFILKPVVIIYFDEHLFSNRVEFREKILLKSLGIYQIFIHEYSLL